MNIEEIQNHLVKKATIFNTGGFKPTNLIEESWIGKVFLFKEHEVVPKDEEGKDMLPLAQLYIPNFPFIPNLLKNTKFITIFISQENIDYEKPMGKQWVLREYSFSDILVKKELISYESDIKPFPLKPIYLDKDFPLWEDIDAFGDKLIEVIENLENTNEIKSYYDIAEHTYCHKIGGYPSYCQNGVDLGKDYEFMIQISSDNKANLNIIDNGRLMFWKNSKTNQWKIYYDFY